MSLTDEEKAKIRAHMGYLNVGSASTFNLGVPAALQTTFMIEGAWDKVLPVAENLVRTYLCRLDEIEAEVFAGSDLADVLETSNIKINPNRLRDLAKYYLIAQESLANLLGVPPNPFDMRSWIQTNSGGINVPVR